MSRESEQTHGSNFSSVCPRAFLTFQSREGKCEFSEALKRAEENI